MLGNRMKINQLILAVVIYSLLYCPISETFAVNSSYVILSAQDNDFLIKFPQDKDTLTKLNIDSVINCLEGVVEINDITSVKTKEEREKEYKNEAYEEALKIPTPSYSECIKCVIARISPLIKRFNEKKNEEVRQLLKKAFNLVNYKKGIKYIDSAKIQIVPLLSFDEKAYKECVLAENFDKNCNFLNLDTSKKNVEGYVFYNDKHGTMRKFDFRSNSNFVSTETEISKKVQIKDTTRGYFDITIGYISVNSSFHLSITAPLLKENILVPQFCILGPESRDGYNFGLKFDTYFIYDNEIYESSLITDIIMRNNLDSFEETFCQILPEMKTKYIFRNIVLIPSYWR